MSGHPTTGCRFRSPILLFWVLVLVLVLVLVAGSCSDDDTASTSTAAATTAATTSTLPTTTTTASAPATTEPPATTAATTATTTVPVLPPLEGVLTVGLPWEVVEGNIWEAFDPHTAIPWPALAWNPAMFLSASGRTCGYLAATDSPALGREGDHWTVTFPLREGYLWSDGEPVTAHDYVFTMEVVEDFDLGALWLWMMHPVMTPDDPDTPENEEVRWVESAEALDDHTVKITFAPSENLPHPLVYQWILMGPVVPEHFWRPIVEACRSEEDPTACLYRADGAGQPSADSFTIESWGQGEVILTANPNCFWRGVTETEYANGALTYSGGRLEEEFTCGDPEGSHIVNQSTRGPFVEKVRIIGYGSAEAALDAFIRGDIGFVIYTSLGSVPERYRERIRSLPDVQININPSDRYQFLALNLRKAPMNDLAFRQALAYVIDKEAILAAAPEGSGFAMSSIVTPVNATWHADDVNTWGRGMTDPERLDAAVQVLEDAGYTWTTPPQTVKDADGEYTGEIIDGEGLTQPDGTPVPELEYLMPADTPLLQAAGEMIPEYATRLGITITWQPTDDSTIRELTGFGEGFPPEDSLAWDLASRSTDVPQSWPCAELYGAFDADNDVVINPAYFAQNITGYHNPDFEALSDALDAATPSIDDARPICADMQRHIADNLPAIVLWSPAITEFWRGTIQLPDTTGVSRFGITEIALQLAKVND